MSWMLRVAPVLVAAVVVAPTPAAAQTSTTAYEELQRFSAALNHIRSSHVDSVTYGGLVRAAIDGMLRSLDPHSWFAPQEDHAKLTQLERGELATTGISVEIVDGDAVVLHVAERSPADRAGIRPADRIRRIDGVPAEGLGANALALRLAGEKGSRVRLTLERGPRLEPDSLTVSMRRDFPRRGSSVRASFMLDAQTGYVALGEFGPSAARDVRDAVRRLRGDKAQRLILDLRGNPGGIVTEAVELAGEFLPARSLVFTTRGRKAMANKEFRTSSAGDFLDLPLIVLIDAGSASASEAMAGSLQDHDRALIVGRRSFGKALVQTGFVVPSGVLMLTVAHVVAPSGRVIQRQYEGLAVEQYFAMAGDSTWQDTTQVFRTAGGRAVRGGGGIAPDVALPAPPSPPAWWSVAADSGYDDAVADSVTHTLPADGAGRAAWLAGSERWHTRLVEPFLARVRNRMRITARSDSALNEFIARRLAARAAYVRWTGDAASELWLRSDPDVRAALELFPRLPALLSRVETDR